MLSGTRANIAIKIFGPDLYELRRQAQRVQAIVEEVPGAVDVAMEQQADIPFLTVEIKRAVVARHGLSVHDSHAALPLEGRRGGDQTRDEHRLIALNLDGDAGLTAGDFQHTAGQNGFQLGGGAARN